MPFLSHTNPIAQKDYGEIPFTEWSKRQVAHEEACRDLDKSPEHLLVDTHDESLDRDRPPHETVSRTLARVASMQLRIQQEVQRQADASASLNSTIRILTIVILVFTIIAAAASAGQFYYARASYLQQKEQAVQR